MSLCLHYRIIKYQSKASMNLILHLKFNNPVHPHFFFRDVNSTNSPRVYNRAIKLATHNIKGRSDFLLSFDEAEYA